MRSLRAGFGPRAAEPPLAAALHSSSVNVQAELYDRTLERCAMAEIRVEPRKRSLAWLWVILLLVIAAAVAWYFLYGSQNR
jgi:hypothetical protein